jgi:hypothetical protein
MVQGTAPASKRQILPTGTYEAKLVNDEIGEYDDIDFETKINKGKCYKYTADLEIDGVADEFSPGKVFTKRLFFTLSSHEKATLPKFLRAIGIPMDQDCNFDTTPAVGKAWVTLDIVRKPAMAGGWTNKVESYIRLKRDPTDRAALPVLGNDGWGDDAPADETEAPF